jgi:hypothetical protein
MVRPSPFGTSGDSTGMRAEDREIAGVHRHRSAEEDVGDHRLTDLRRARERHYAAGIFRRERRKDRNMRKPLDIERPRDSPVR